MKKRMPKLLFFAVCGLSLTAFFVNDSHAMPLPSATLDGDSIIVSFVDTNFDGVWEISGLNGYVLVDHVTYLDGTVSTTDSFVDAAFYPGFNGLLYDGTNYFADLTTSNSFAIANADGIVTGTINYDYTTILPGQVWTFYAQLGDLSVTNDGAPSRFLNEFLTATAPYSPGAQMVAMSWMQGNFIDFGDNTAQMELDFHANIAPVAPVPEPATMLLFGTGLAGVAARVNRGRKSA